MKKAFIPAIVAFGCALFATDSAKAQNGEFVVVSEEVTGYAAPDDSKTHYYTTSSDNWFIKLGAGISVPFVEDKSDNNAETRRQITAAYNFGFGKWFSPYVAWRLDFFGGAAHWNNGNYSKMKYVQGNFDIMWDMFNSISGVNTRRIFSIVPFVGLGGSYSWDINSGATNGLGRDNKEKTSQWTLPVSAGLQLRFRLCKYVDFFAEGRASFYGDNWNSCTYGEPVDINVTAIGGFQFNIGGADFKSYSHCDYTGYINSLNNQINDLRGALATTSAALAAAEARLPCPEAAEQETVITEPAPLLATVRFNIDSSMIADREKVNVYNIAQWMKQNPDQSVVIQGYADRDTGTSSYNMALSQRRAKAVSDMLINEYGISPDRLSVQANGSDVQPYGENNWNRIVIFSQQ